MESRQRWRNAAQATRGDLRHGRRPRSFAARARLGTGLRWPPRQRTWRRCCGVFSLFDGRTLLSIFNADLSGIDVPPRKPDPALFLLPAKALDIPPVQCLVVEDTPAGIRAGRGRDSRAKPHDGMANA